MSSAPETSAIVRSLKELLAEQRGDDRVLDLQDGGPDSIRRLGLSSGEMLAFLVAVEDAFALSWDDDLDPAILTSFEAMAEYLAQRLSARAAAG